MSSGLSIEPYCQCVERSTVGPFLSLLNKRFLNYRNGLILTVVGKHVRQSGLDGLKGFIIQIVKVMYHHLVVVLFDAVDVAYLKSVILVRELLASLFVDVDCMIVLSVHLECACSVCHRTFVGKCQFLCLGKLLLAFACAVKVIVNHTKVDEQIEVVFLLFRFFFQKFFSGIELLEQGKTRQIHVAVTLVFGLGVKVFVQGKSFFDIA